MRFTFFLNLIFLNAWLVTGCATSYKKVALNEDDFKGKPVAIINSVPFVEQTTKLCGPTALYMVAKPHKSELTLEEVRAITFTPAARGTFKQDLLAASRRIGLAPYAVDSVPHLFEYLSQGTPVVIFHKTEFLWKQYWHYSVITGYNRLTEKFQVHIGEDPNHDISFSKIIGSWEEGGKWAYVVQPPGKLPAQALFQEALDNSFAFLRLGYEDAAYQLSEEILKRWPERYEADVIMAQALMKKNQHLKALQFLERASLKRPENVMLREKIYELSKGERL